MIYVCADIHGRKDKFDQILKKINLQKDDKLIIQGDVIDRGPDGIILLQEIRDNPQFVLMLGNHEYMMLETVAHSKDYLSVRRWYNNGGKVTHDAYLALPEEEQKRLIEYLRDLPVNLSVHAGNQEFLLVHGAPLSFFTRNAYEYLDAVEYAVWERLSRYVEIPDGQTIVFGHTPTTRYAGSKMPPRIWHGKNMIGIDCGCAFSDDGGQLGCLCLDNMNEYYSDIDSKKGDEQGEKGDVCSSN